MMTLEALVKLCLVLKKFIFVRSYLLWLSTVDGQSGCLATLWPHLPTKSSMGSISKIFRQPSSEFLKIFKNAEIIFTLETADVFLSRQEFWREFQNFELFIQKVCNYYKLMAKNVQAWTINKWVYFTLKHCSKSLQLLPSKTCCPCDELEKAELFIPKTLKI